MNFFSIIREHLSHAFPDSTLGFVIFTGLSKARLSESGVSLHEAKYYNSFVVKTHGYSKNICSIV